MTSWLTGEMVRDAAERARVRVKSVSETVRGDFTAVIDSQDPWGLARFLVEVSKESVSDPAVQRIAVALMARAKGAESYARAVQLWVQKNIRFIRERLEVFQAPRYTLEMRAGDCDCHAALVLCLLEAGGVGARMRFLTPDGSYPVHVLTQAYAGGVWVDLETTIAADYGEDPIAAAARLGLRTRRDITNGGTSVTIQGAMAAVAVTTEGVDLAQYAGKVDWAALGQKAAFAFIRTGDGLGTDKNFAVNWSGAGAAGVMRGPYQFFRAAQDPVAQADKLASQVGSLGLFDLPPVIDVEEEGVAGVDGQTVLARIGAWTARIMSTMGVTPILYTNLDTWAGLPASALDGGLPLWVANPGVSAPHLPRGWQTRGWDFWQVRFNAAYPGVEGQVDVNVFNGSKAALKFYAAKKASAPVVGGSPGGSGPSGSGLPGSGSQDGSNDGGAGAPPDGGCDGRG